MEGVSGRLFTQEWADEYPELYAHMCTPPDSCPVCLADFDEEDRHQLLSPLQDLECPTCCTHFVCGRCWWEIFSRHGDESQCPLCREYVDEWLSSIEFGEMVWDNALANPPPVTVAEIQTWIADAQMSMPLRQENYHVRRQGLDLHYRLGRVGFQPPERPTVQQVLIRPTGVSPTQPPPRPEGQRTAGGGVPTTAEPRAFATPSQMRSEVIAAATLRALRR